MQKNENSLRRAPFATTPGAGVYRLSGSESNGAPETRGLPDQTIAGRETLPYKVELWDLAKQAVEQVLALTASGSIGYAAYYAATREYPQRYITLRNRDRIVSRWNGPEH